MVEALGFRVKRLFVGVFVAGTALAGGVMWGVYQGLVTPAIGREMMILVFIILIMGGMGSVGGAFVAIRENEFRAQALGFSIVLHRTPAGVIGALMATLAGAMLAPVLRYNGPSASMSFEIMVDSILLMTVIGGMGTSYGPALGAIVILLAQYYLQPGMVILSGLLAGLPILPHLFDPDRWLLWMGVLFVVIVYFFPTGIVGRLRQRR
jgi:branched-chain amino acid transport system permease protein